MSLGILKGRSGGRQETFDLLQLCLQLPGFSRSFVTDQAEWKQEAKNRNRQVLALAGQRLRKPEDSQAIPKH
jgi:hypothetical protein